MKKKIVLTMSFVSVIAILITTTLTMIGYYQDRVDEVENSLVLEAEYIKNAYLEQGLDYLEKLNEKIVSRITIIADDGDVLYDNAVHESEMENHLTRPEVVDAIKYGNGKDTRMSTTINQETYYYAIKIDGDIIVRVSKTVDTVFGETFSILPWVLTISVIVMVIAFFLSNILTKKIVAPLNKIDFNNPENSNIYEELNPLVTRMSKQNEQIEKNLVEHKRKQIEFNAIISNMTEGLVVIDTKGDVWSINQSATKLCGFNGKFEMGSSVYLLNRDLDFYTAIEKTLRGKSCEHCQYINGRFCKFFINPVETENDIQGAVIIIMDSTEIENREAMRREFTANVSHELKTPLTSISGYAEIIKTGIAKDGDIRGFAEKIYNESQRLIALVADIIKLSRLDESEGIIKKENCNLYKIVEKSVNVLTTNADKKEITISLKGEVFPVFGVPVMIEEMIYNLIENAIKYNKVGGTVKILVEKFGDKAKFVIQDTGIGIPSEDKDRIFERFYRVDKSHSRDKTSQTGGTGLGLSIVKHCVKLHGGEINVDSVIGKGTTMTIIL
ncbi:MAG: ATP-binding protein [Clostridia bacterium]